MATIRLDLTTDLAQAGERIALLSEKNLRFAIAGALTQAGKATQADLKQHLPRYIDRPNPWTMGSTFVQFAKPSDLTVEVGIRGADRSGRTGAAKYLAPLIEGGTPRLKGADLSASKLARTRGVLIPAQNGPIKTNTYGNVSLSNYAKVLSAARTKGSNVYIAPVRKGSTTLGVFERKQAFIRGTSTIENRTRRIFTIDPNPKRRSPRLPLTQLLQDDFSRHIQPQLQASLEAELKRLLA